MVKFTPEQVLEDKLIEQLTSGVSQWTYRADLKTEDDLWNNLRDKLEKNNKDVLKEVPLTEQEFQQIKNQLTFPSFYRAAADLTGENGISRVEVQREDASLGTIRLKVLARQDIAGGMSSYEVINQFQSDKRSKADANRRFDVTLLINGLPMIHIELKNKSHSFMEAFNQISKYLVEGKFTGIYSSLQMFVVTNGSDTRYIAAQKKLNAQFLTKWVNESNQPVTDYLSFAQSVLSIPMAHKMVTQYTVLDKDSRSLILLRPYQIHAIEAVKRASRERKSGYVWHTTGSGKTLTSYKVARNLLQIASIDKTIFIVDRVDLDQQTSNSFTSYAEYDVISVEETDSVNDLIKKLLSNDRQLIITTIQKLNHVMKRFAAADGNKKREKLKQLNLAFIVDECHRAVSPSKKREIDSFFVRSLWYGFTGTPIFKENAKHVVGDLARTTEQQYGERLHEYTVKEAIHDKAVLGFQVDYQSTFSEDQLDEAVVKLNPSLEDDIDDLELIEKEALLPKSVYETQEHMLEVIRSIVNNSQRKLGFKNGPGQTYNAILTTSSIALAQKYYQLIQEVKEGKHSVTISEKTKRVLPDFPKVAITYSISENEETSVENQKHMKEAIEQYNKGFGSSFSMETMRGYNRNINERLSRKKDSYKRRSEQLDLVIVVDRLLTGFDAPCLSTLFIDRPPMQPHDLIQAFSRTNRLFDKSKKFGQIVTFQTPKLFESKVKEALILYSNGGENDVLAPVWEEAKREFIQAIDELRQLFVTAEVIDIESLSTAELKQFVKAFQTVDRTYTAAQVYSDFKDDMMGTEFLILPEEIENFNGKYENALARLKELRDDTEELSDIDIAYELESVKKEEINYEYILMLIQTFVPSGEDEYELVSRIDEKATEEVNKYLGDLAQTNDRLAKLMQELWDNIRLHPEDFRDKNVSYLLEEKIQEVQNQTTHDLAKKWCVAEDAMAYLIANFDPTKEKQNGEKELKRTWDYPKYLEETENPKKKLQAWPMARKDIQQTIIEQIMPLQKR